jgi:hypothetical protein
MKDRTVPLKVLEEAARRATFDALGPLPRVSAETRKNLVLGTRWDGDSVVFEMYVPGERPSDAKVLTQAVVDQRSGEVLSVKINVSMLEAGS